jgi:long-subunit fatty acid transport protein
MRTSATVLLLLAAGGSAWAQDQQLGARTKAMGGSYTAFEDDPVSVWLNPAGIATQPNALSISYQTYTTYPLQSERTSTGEDLSAEAVTSFVDPAFIPSYLGLVFQVGTPELPMALGICYARPYHLNYSFDELEDPFVTAFEPDTNIEQSLTRFRAAFAMDFPIAERGQGGFLTHVSAGLGLDIGYEHWRFEGEVSKSGSSTAPGFGLGVLVGLYDDTESFKVNFGAAYQSAVRWQFSTDPEILPAFNMPQQVNVGLTGYFLRGFTLRTTVDVQWVDWSETAEEPAFVGQPAFEDAFNFSLGAEYRIPASERVSLYPRVGYRRFNAPWEDPDDLPMTANFKLLVDTDDSSFDIFTTGIGVSFTDERGKLWVIDLGADFGGDSFNFALGFTYEI